MPKISILLPTYKPNKEFLTESLGSIIAQTFTDWELHINDQKSDTDTKAMIAKYLEDPRIHFHTNTDNPGIGQNWNDCLQYANSDYVQYMFDDDYWEPHYLETAVQILEENPTVGILSMEHEYNVTPGDPRAGIYEPLKKRIQEHFTQGEKNGKEFLFWWMNMGLKNMVGEPMFVMLRKSIVDTIGPFREDMVQTLDTEYWTRCLLHSDYYFMPGNFGFFRVHSAQMSATNEKSTKGLFDRCRTFLAVIKQLHGKEKRSAAKIFLREFNGMACEFIRIFGDGHIVKTPLKHPWLLLRSTVNYLKKRRKK